MEGKTPRNVLLAKMKQSEGCQCSFRSHWSLSDQRPFWVVLFPGIQKGKIKTELANH
jgi:hypothetical protein